MNKADKAECLAELNEFILDIDCLDALKHYTSEANIFSILKLSQFEIRHSNMLSWLLNPNENHGLGDKFLKRILFYATNGTRLEMMKGLRPIDIDLMSLSDAIVFREKDKIDILVVSDSNKLVLAIENKVFSKEHSNQLERYRNLLQKNYGSDYRIVLIYLTPDRTESSDPENWIDMSYDYIREQLELLINNTDINRKTKVYIEDYIFTIRRNIVEDKEIKDICMKIYYKHKEALDLIFENIPDNRNKISAALHSFLSSYSNDLDITYLEKDSGSYTYRFVPNALKNTKGYGNGWVSDNYLVVYEIYIPKEGTIALHLYLGPAKEEYEHYRQELLDIAVANNSIFSLKGTKIRNKWKTIDTLRLGNVENWIDEVDNTEVEEKLKRDLEIYLKKKMPEQMSRLKTVFVN